MGGSADEADFGGSTRGETKPSAAKPETGGGALPPGAGAAPSTGASEGVSADDVPRGTSTPTNPVQPQSGTLTAGSWDDNVNFEHFQKYRKDPVRAQRPGVLPLSDDELVQAHQAHAAAKSANTRLDVALVIDTTGSMGDEIRYLQSEFIGISQAIEAAYPNASQRWALVLYRDQGDDYVTRYFDFRDQPEAFREKLAAQAAGGGGDFPEAPEAAIEVLNQFAWRDEPDVARIAFWVADAPHHNENAAKLAQALRTTRAQGIHVYPVASSGVDDLTELSMRTAAQLTGGRYLFLTDDSGVGGAHKEPTLPCYYVTKLNDALLRMVDLEMRGVYVAPDAAKIVRTVGQPVNGTCTLQSGATVTLF